MYTGIVIYGTDPTQAASALAVARNLFSQFGSKATKVSLLEFVVQNGGRLVGEREVLLADLEEKISGGEATAFQVYNDGESDGAPAISFGYNVPAYGGLSFIDVQIGMSIYEIDEKVEAFAKIVATHMSFKYAIAYGTESASIAYKYSTGVNLIRIFPFENTSLFTRDLPGRSPGTASYERGTLRMVYPLNVLNGEHMEIRVGDLSLKEWIRSDSSRGSLESISNNMWLWSVKETDLPGVNHACGESGILLAWQKAPVNRPLRKLP
ncbi:hypothetical protein [Burkholderia sp. Ac-20349]|uniref:hypothetical protein n=1 Tax=Burkholderia sp. Ac-20349 TaxID=2703893 RepID=UPI00197C9414|nr:hypothetical protein [Burkholderia sp. Ac-20349]MBN3842232.1 hypothetical protein [Burkholderia sp. Ac-20349]